MPYFFGNPSKVHSSYAETSVTITQTIEALSCTVSSQWQGQAHVRKTNLFISFRNSPPDL